MEIEPCVNMLMTLQEQWFASSYYIILHIVYYTMDSKANKY